LGQAFPKRIRHEVCNHNDRQQAAEGVRLFHFSIGISKPAPASYGFLFSAPLNREEEHVEI
jgi:hypothetical protein